MQLPVETTRAFDGDSEVVALGAGLADGSAGTDAFSLDSASALAEFGSVLELGESGSALELGESSSLLEFGESGSEPASGDVRSEPALGDVGSEPASGDVGSEPELGEGSAPGFAWVGSASDAAIGFFGVRAGA